MSSPTDGLSDSNWSDGASKDVSSLVETAGHPGKLFSSTYQPKKRKAAFECAKSGTRLKRLKLAYSKKYAKLYNDDVTNSEPSEGASGLTPSQVGGTIWTVEEKVLLFRALAQKGRHDHHELASMVQTKCVPEIAKYSQLLQAAAIKHDLHSTKRKGLFDISNIEAAHEISPDCEAALETAADAMSLHQYIEDERAEKEKHPRSWLITRDVAKRVDQNLKLGNEGERKVSNEIPAAILLNAKSFLTLSKQIFMNSNDLGSNWRTYRGGRSYSSSSPSIMHSAFSEFYCLLFAQVKRLVHLSLSIADSRIKCQQAKRQVKRSDVLAGIQTAGMKFNTRETWTGVARKCDLRVLENVQGKKAWGKEYTFDEVEEYLGNYEYRRGRYRSRTQGRSGSRSSSEPGSGSRTSDSDAAKDHGTSVSETEPSDPQSPDSDTSLTPTLPGEDDSTLVQQHLLQDAYLDSLDLHQSHAAETRLWDLLGQNPPPTLASEATQLPKRPLPPEKPRDEFTDWTEWVDYAADWETYALPKEEEFEAVGRARRRRRLSAQDSSDDDDNAQQDESDIETEDSKDGLEEEEVEVESGEESIIEEN